MSPIDRRRSYDTTLTRHIWESLAFSAGICLHATRAVRQEPAPHRRGPVQGRRPRCAPPPPTIRGPLASPPPKASFNTGQDQERDTERIG